MGLPARRMEPRAPRVTRQHLRLVKPTPSRSTRGRSSSAVSAKAAAGYFRIFSACICVLAVLGIGRVWLSVQATESSLESMRLRGDIQSERYEGDMLEVRQSALGSPSRIRKIAGTSFGMAPAGDVTYLDLTKKKTAEKPADTRQASAAQGLLARILDLTAGEAEVLLVGDVGLASAR